MLPPTSLTLLAGALATLLFTTANVPMLLRAFRTKDLRSYSLAYLLASNLGNLVYWLYVGSLPFGPIWVMHAFYTLSAALMLFWYLRYRKKETDENHRRFERPQRPSDDGL